jgi:HlyD family secretion protein
MKRIACALAITLVALCLAISAIAATAPSVSLPPTVTVIPAKSGEIVETVSATGSLVAREEVLVNAQVDGQPIIEILVDEGDIVEQGQILARLQRDTLQANLAQFDAQIARADASAEQARAQMAQGRATLVQAGEALARSRSLLSSGTASRETFEQREANTQVAAAQLAAAQAQLNAAIADRALATAQRQEVAVRLARTDIKAPVAGRISRRGARVGAVVGMTGEPLFRIISNATLELDAAVPEITLARLRVGQSAQIGVTGYKEPRTGRVRLVSPEVSPTTRLGRVRITLDDSTNLPLGGFARARVEVARASGVLVPLSAVLTRPDGAELQVVADGIVSTRRVHVGLRDGSAAQIQDGVAEGEQVIAISGTFVRNGDRVTAVPPPVSP